MPRELSGQGVTATNVALSNITANVDLTARISEDLVLHEVETQLCAQVGGVVLHWPSVAGRRYDVQRLASPGASGTVVEIAIPATPPMNTVTQRHQALSGQFYRIRVERSD